MTSKSHINRKDLSKEIQVKNRELQTLFGDKTIEEKVFTDKFLEIYQDVQDKVGTLLISSEKLSHEGVDENKEKLFQNSFRKAILSIIEISSINEQELDFSILKPLGKLRTRGGKSIIELKTGDKYNDFLKVSSELFFGNNYVKINRYSEKKDKNKMRKIPYHIINIIGTDFSKTLLISDQIGEATYLYNGLIEPNQFKELEKGQEINGLLPIKIVYGENYSNDLKQLISQKDFYEISPEEITDEDLLLQEEEYFNKLYIKTILSRITDADGNNANVDLNTIGLVEFRKLYFGNNTKYGKISGQRLLKNNSKKANGLANNKSLYHVLKIYGIDRKDLLNEKIDYTDDSQIIELLNNIRDEKGNKINVDFKKINLFEFSKLDLGIGTKFGKIKGISILTNMGGENNITLRKILKIIGIDRPDLPSEIIDFKNRNHIIELLKNITDKEGNNLDIDLKKVGLNQFRTSYFGNGTKFGKIIGYTFLSQFGAENNQSLKKLLELGGINRGDLAELDFEYNNPNHIKEVLNFPTDRDGNPKNIDLNSIRMKDFSNMYFGFGTKFGIITGQSILKKNGEVNNPTLKKVLNLIGINRSDLKD